MTRLEVLLNEYQKVFKKSYPLVITNNKTDDEMIKDIKNCILSGKPADDPVYEDDTDY